MQKACPTVEYEINKLLLLMVTTLVRIDYFQSPCNGDSGYDYMERRMESHAAIGHRHPNPPIRLDTIHSSPNERQLNYRQSSRGD